jgi:hypothetical protein
MIAGWIDSRKGAKEQGHNQANILRLLRQGQPNPLD